MTALHANNKLYTFIMAAGKGTRMKDPGKAKVMYEVLGKPMIHYVLDVAFAVQSHRVLAVVGYQRDVVSAYIGRSHPKTEIVVQAEQLGTGHAIMQTQDVLSGHDGSVVILSGDVPLLTAHTIQGLIDNHRESQASATILSARYDDPAGYGRIIRNPDGSVKKIVEHKDATAEEKAVHEINSGIYIFDCRKLFEALKTLRPNNIQKEYYLTDVFEYFWKQHWIVNALPAEHPDEIQGVNTVGQLEEVRKVLLSRL